MRRRNFLHMFGSGLACLAGLILSGCRGRQHAHILDENDDNMVGSHAAGSAVYDPLVSDAVQQLLDKEAVGIQQTSYIENAQLPKKVCFVGVENASAEELGDFREDLYEAIDQKVVDSDLFDPISRRYVEVGLRECRIGPLEDLFLPNNQRMFTAAMERQGQPFDYLLFAKITSGTTRSNGSDYQRDYRLTLEMVNIHTGSNVKHSAQIRKGYHKSVLGRAMHY